MAHRFPSEVSKNKYGKCLVAIKNLNPGEAAERFEGEIVDSYENVPNYLKNYALLVDDKRWLVPKSDAMYANHSCEPNCEVEDELNIVVKIPIKKGEEICFDYALAYKDENPCEWQPEWTFKCQCGSLRNFFLYHKFYKYLSMQFIAWKKGFLR